VKTIGLSGNLDMGGTLSQFRSSGLAAKIGLAGAFLLAYVALEWISFIHEYKGVPITPWNPGLGIVFALIMLTGAYGGLVLFLGVVIAETVVLDSGLAWPIILAIAAIISFGYTIVAVITRRYLQLDIGLSRLYDVLTLLGSGLAGAAIITVLLTGLLMATGQLVRSDLLQASLPLLVGDVIGIAVITPVVLRFAHRFGKERLASVASVAPEAALYTAVIVALLWLIIGSQNAYGFTYFYVFFVPVVAAALRHGIDGACLSLAVTQLGLVGLLHLYGYDARVFTEFQTLMCVLTATGLIVGVVVSERRSADRLVREAEERLKEKEAEAAQAARFSLVSGMASALAHEINQPMTAARALARSAQHILRMPNADLARADGNLTTMIAQIDHVGAVVRHMRDFVRQGRPHVSTVDIRGVLENALMLVQADAAMKQIAIEPDAPGDLPLVYGDRIQLEQVVLNLVRNAIEAIAGTGRTDGRIRVFACRLDAPSRIEIGVADNGPGIEPALAGRLFQPLTTSKREGLGLGLPISASIVESHGGRIWLQTQAPGATEFRFSLPLEPSQAA
jgi:two-component system, LuxR family, sensor kinase FixL